MHLMFGFSGRIGRGGWWLAQLASIVLVLGLLGLFASVGGEARAGGLSAPAALSGGMVLAMLATVALGTWINIASTVKRFHDRDKSGLWFLIALAPFGSFWILVECGFLAGTPGENRLGVPGNWASGTALDDTDIEAASRAARRFKAEAKPAASAVARPVGGRSAGSVPSFGRRAG